MQVFIQNVYRNDVLLTKNIVLLVNTPMTSESSDKLKGVLWKKIEF